MACTLSVRWNEQRRTPQKVRAPQISPCAAISDAHHENRRSPRPSHSRTMTTAALKLGPKPTAAERILLGAGLVLRLCQTNVIQHGVTYSQICNTAVRLGCTHTDHARGVRAATPSTVRVALSRVTPRLGRWARTSWTSPLTW